MADHPPIAEPQTTPQVDSGDTTRQRAFLLHTLQVAPGRKLTRGELTKKAKTKAAEAAGISPAAVPGLVARLGDAGLVHTVKSGRAVVYELTDTGAAHLETIRDQLPPTKGVGTRGRFVPPASDQVRDYRTGYLLLQALRAPRNTVSDAEANSQLDSYARDALELNAATASQLRRELARQGLLASAGSGRATEFSLTPAGRVAIGNTAFPADRTFPLPGRVLNDLLEAAREVGKQFVPAAADQPRTPSGGELEHAILSTFEELLRERYAVSGLVPVPDVRAAIRSRFGDRAARHDMFDEAILGLWRSKKVRLTPIADHAKATPDQLHDAIPGLGETLFYLEAARDPAAV
jgi:predicted transcriptional regulator